MTEAQAQAATAVYGQLTLARKELAQLQGVRPYLCGVSLHAPGMQPLKLEGIQAERLARVADAADAWLLARIAALEIELDEL